jgi:hypothetical protein
VNKKIGIIIIAALTITMMFNYSFVEAEENSLYLTEDYVELNPNTGKYSSDWSHLNNKENLKLQKDVQDFHNEIKQRKSSRLLSKDITKHDDLRDRLEKFIESFDPEFVDLKKPDNLNSNKTVSFKASSNDDYFDSYYSKLLEVEIHLAKGVLSLSELAGVNENATGARDHATRYATKNNWYTSTGQVKTWDNPADTLRHFAWNYMNSYDFGTGKARTAGDIHELALHGVKYVDRYASTCNYSIGCMMSYAASDAIQDGYAAQNSFMEFNSMFNNASIMDFINNSEGRKAFVQGYDNYSEPFNIGLNKGSLVQFPTWINTTRRTSAWYSFR